MNKDPFTDAAINDGGIWTATDCLAKEKSILDDIIRVIESRGFVLSPGNHRVWVQGDKKILLCLVDDIRSASDDYETDVPYLFDKNTLVITDNYIACPTQYQVCYLPSSFFHIYHHEPNVIWTPDKDFCFSVNRMDHRRLTLMLELGMRSHLTDGYINFNCQSALLFGPRAPDFQQLRQNFSQHFDDLPQAAREKYRSVFNMLLGIMPYRNYEMDHEMIHTRSRCNIVLESYGSDNTVALSEKIFRALVLPVPWTLYGGHYSVAYLESLGFDCLNDIINHNHYDQLKEIEDKVRIFIWFSLKFAKESATIDQKMLIERGQRAARHNRDLLKSFQLRWAGDFDRWLASLDQRLALGI